MRMTAVARFFDREQAYDGYTDAALFFCQFSSFDDSASDGSTNRRRGMSVAPAVTIPTRRVLRLQNQRWLVSAPTDDSFLNRAIRTNYNLKRITHSLASLTAGEACTGAAGTAVYAHLHYYRDTSNTRTDSDLDVFWNIFLSPTEVSTPGRFFRDADLNFYRVRQSYVTPEGSVVAQADQMETGTRVAAVFGTGTYDPVADTVSAGTVTAQVLQFDVSQFYRYRQQAEASDVKAGDRAVFVAASALTPVVGMEFAMLGRDWRAMIVQAEGDAWAIHARLK